ncbi:MAG: hypothetical protein ACQETH_12525 [Candidatus Rifleibacteriota bacterium]
MTETNRNFKGSTLITAIVGWVCFFLIFRLAGQQITIDSKAAAYFLSASMLVILSVWVVKGFSKLDLSRQIYLLIGVAGLVIVFTAAGPLVRRAELINQTSAAPGELLFLTCRYNILQPGVEKIVLPIRNKIFEEISEFGSGLFKEAVHLIIILSIAQLVLASGVGLWIAKGIDKLSHLIPIALVATIADIWSVSAGATAKIIISPHINYFLLRFPLITDNEIPYLIGLTDFLFFAIFFQASIRYGLGTLKNTLLLSASFVIAFSAAIITSKGLPVLPFMAIIFVAGNYKNLEIDKKEMKLVFVFLLVVLAIFAAITYIIH